MRKFYAAALIILLLIAYSVSAGAYGSSDYNLADYDIDIKVSSDNVYEITETIVADFFIPKHGIYREIPMRYEGRKVTIDNISVSEQYTQSKSGGNLVLKIGDPDVTLTGRREYIIRYRFNMGRDNNEGFDLFYFNIIGTGWDTTISDIDFTISMPDFFEKEDVKFYKGSSGSSDTSGIFFETVGMNINGSVDYLRAGEGLTAHIVLPESAFAGESGNDNSLYFSIGAWILSVFLIILAYIIWNTKGRDPLLVPSVHFTPPIGMTPAEVGYVIDGIVDNRDITSLIFYWADKGYLDITESGKNEFLFIKKNEPETNNHFETYMFRRLFSYGKDGWVSTNDLKQEFYADIPIIKTQVKEKFEGNKALFTKESKLCSGFIFFLSLIPSLILLFVVMEGFPPIEALFTSAFVFFGLLFCGGVAVATMKKWNIFTRGGRYVRSILFALFIFIMTIAFFLYAFSMEEGFSMYYHSAGFLIAEAARTAIVTFILFAFSAATIKRTEYGHRMLEHLIGLRNFINEAEMDKLKQMIDDDPDYFYNILPFAIVLGLEKKWAGKMDMITMEPPKYYSTSTGAPINNTYVAASLMRCVSRTGYVMTVGKSSSGSGGSGGGFSGGGGGGGGGGSW